MAALTRRAIRLARDICEERMGLSTTSTDWTASMLTRCGSMFALISKFLMARAQTVVSLPGRSLLEYVAREGGKKLCVSPIPIAVSPTDREFNAVIR